MNPKLFTPFYVRGLTLKNRIVMSPMIMCSCDEHDGMVTDFHLVHYATRAMGQVGLIMVEATAVLPEGRVNDTDLGIWSDEHIEGYKRLTSLIHKFGSAAGIQLIHGGRKNEFDNSLLAPSAIPFDDDRNIPKEMSIEDIKEIVNAFKDAVNRAKEAGFDVIEIHGAHGYLISSFLSPLSNLREDEYGGDEERRYRFLKEVIQATRTTWDGPLFVRISARDFHECGNTPETSVAFAKRMKSDGVDLIDCSAGGVVSGKSVKILSYPGYQVPYAEKIRREANIPTGAVGLITKGEQAEEILQNERADLIFIGRELLFNPYWTMKVADEMRHEIEIPRPYYRDRVGGRVRRF
ncbi:NADPH dehydrogenase NamA [Neobacillus niacini]|uniref:NADPH dehydrogenase NamA n=1 Tax=Neobacillus niacini TaxID=86668 RepID=UPI003001CBA4